MIYTKDVYQVHYRKNHRRLTIKDFSRGPNRFEKKGPKKDKDGLRVNREISAPQVRVIDEDGKMLGVMAPRDAVKLAEERGLDLLEIAPTATPPTCKIMDYGKWKYEAKKKAHQARKNQTVIVIKEIQLRPRTEQHDVDTKLRHARRFLLEGDKVKITIRFVGREAAYLDQGMQLMNKFIESLNDLCLIDAPPKHEGKQLFAMLGPDPVKIKEYKQKQPKEESPAIEQEPG